jgi:hypothetical protein
MQLIKFNIKDISIFLLKLLKYICLLIIQVIILSNKLLKTKLISGKKILIKLSKYMKININIKLAILTTSPKLCQYNTP